jgi:hypothetical protein
VPVAGPRRAACPGPAAWSDGGLHATSGVAPRSSPIRGARADRQDDRGGKGGSRPAVLEPPSRSPVLPLRMAPAAIQVGWCAPGRIWIGHPELPSQAPSEFPAEFTGSSPMAPFWFPAVPLWPVSGSLPPRSDGQKHREFQRLASGGSPSSPEVHRFRGSGGAESRSRIAVSLCVANRWATCPVPMNGPLAAGAGNLAPGAVPGPRRRSWGTRQATRAEGIRLSPGRQDRALPRHAPALPDATPPR